MLGHTTGTTSFFQTMAPFLIANVLTVAFVYSFVKIHQKELTGEEEGRLIYLWLIVLVFSFMLMGSTLGAFTRLRIKTRLRSSSGAKRALVGRGSCVGFSYLAQQNELAVARRLLRLRSKPAASS
jgi:hypothetical protein